VAIPMNRRQARNGGFDRPALFSGVTGPGAPRDEDRTGVRIPDSALAREITEPVRDDAWTVTRCNNSMKGRFP
jgi:hypothetical protein